MTREEAYRLAIRACEETWNEKTCKQIREALEKEPFMNKLCVDHQVCHEDKVKVLNKIIAEIEEIYMNITYEENHKVGGTWGLRKALEIIDKYKAESEEIES